MTRQQFLTTAFFTAIETYFFNEAIMSGHYLFAVFWAFLVIRNLQVSYVMGKIVYEIDKHIKRKK